jgi:hypothetical protein
MGDKLRARLGIAADWTHKEIKFYQENASKELGCVYVIENLKKDYPANRVIYWDKKLEIKDNSVVEKNILEIIKEKGLAYALLVLEGIAIKKFF